MMVVNDISRADLGFESGDNEITLVTSQSATAVSRRSKAACAAAVWDAIGVLDRSRPAASTA